MFGKEVLVTVLCKCFICFLEFSTTFNYVEFYETFESTHRFKIAVCKEKNEKPNGDDEPIEPSVNWFRAVWLANVEPN